MPTPPKKKFPGIFIVIAISFMVYLTVVTVIIFSHYKKKAKDTPSHPTAASKLIS